MENVPKPIHRSALRFKLGTTYYQILRYLLWIKMRNSFTRSRSDEWLPYSSYEHQTILLRKLKDVDMWMQYNKITNLKIATMKLNKVILHPGDVFSFWKLIGKPIKRKGYAEGMILHNGTVCAGIGGGLCQLSNLIFWMTIHTPLTVTERHRHGYDVFPDSNRTQPFGSGATCYYPYIDLMIRNDTQDKYQLLVSVGDEFLHGEWRVSAQPQYRYRIIEKNHIMKREFWGGYSRYNELYQQKLDLENKQIDEKRIVSNTAIMMYPPLLSKSLELQ